MLDFKMQRLSTTDDGFDQQLARLLAWDEQQDASIHDRVKQILARVRQEGDSALIEYTKAFDLFNIESPQKLEIPRSVLDQALGSLSGPLRNALETAAERIRAYASHQTIKPWQFTEADGTVLGQHVTPLDRAGLYVPGGKASYPSSVLMNAIPAKVAGVRELVMVVPTPGGETNQLVLAAAKLAGVDRVFRIGGAQAIAALAYGTETIPAVEKIVGPGNIYVATAKKLVFGQVGIDMVAGPSEILVICDGRTDPEWITADLFSQAEHDEDAQAILLCPDTTYLDTVESCIRRMLPEMERADVIAASLRQRGGLIQVSSLDEAVEVANRIAPEHLELSVAEPETLVNGIRNAGAVFMGRYTAEALGDYCAGPNHVLPTSGTARFSSPLGVYDFQKRTSIINCSDSGASELGKVASVLARGESLTAHARSAEFRIRGQ
ncbi:MAG: histidinol dehydrogenase [Pseudomonadota bacterium]|jgi:histidinol dehydrogenase|nr:histidinol dehydrogenase [Pseudomonadota bacterium]